MLGKILFPLIARGESEDAAWLAECVSDGRRIGRYESSVCRKDGVSVVVLFSISPLRSSTGEVIGSSLILRDITASKEADARLRLQGAALEAAADAIVITDARGLIEWVNPAFSGLTGYGPEEALQLLPQQFLHSSATTSLADIDLWRTITSGQVWRGEVSRQRKDKTTYIEQQTVTPVFDEAGRIIHFVAVKQDVSARRHAEEELETHRHHLQELIDERTIALRDSELQLRSILESSPSGILGVDADGCFRFVNPAAAEMLGYRPEEMLGRDAHDLLHGLGQDGEWCPDRACLLMRSVVNGLSLSDAIETFWRADKQPVPVMLSSRPMISNGRADGCVLSFADYTAQLNAEMAKESARQEAERLAKTRTEFLANMSHEIRTPLNGVLGAAQLGYRQSEDEPRLNIQFRRILDSGRLLLGIINDILDLSKIEAGKLMIEYQPLRPAEVIRSVTALFTEQVQSKHLDYRIEIDSALEQFCIGDQLRLSQILMNLLSNAIKFTERGHVAVVAVRFGNTLSIAVQDSGVGMSTDQLQRIFTPFEQADSTVTRRFGGTGLGLAISRRLAELMGGSISVNSQLDVGTQFQICLPWSATEGAVVSLPVNPLIPDENGVGKRLFGVRLLVADDHEVNRLVLTEMLSAEGAIVDAVSGGESAVEHVSRRQAQPYDAVLMDVQMPGLDGYQATAHILEIAPGLPVIAQTAHAMAEERAQCFAAGMVDQVSKPIEQDVLVATLLRYVGRRVVIQPEAEKADLQLDGGVVQAGFHIDWGRLHSRYGSKPAFLGRLLAAANESLAEVPVQIRALTAENDLDQLGKVIHAFKGTAGSIMANGLMEQARQLEKTCKADQENWEASALQLAGHVADCIAEIEAYRALKS
jgi:PAS domain S-box-containing protein